MTHRQPPQRGRPVSCQFSTDSTARLGDRLGELASRPHPRRPALLVAHQKRQRDASAMTNPLAALRAKIPAVATPPAGEPEGYRDRRRHHELLRARAAPTARASRACEHAHRKRLTLCVSSRWAARSAFVLRDRLHGVKRNLRADEIVAQVIAMATTTAWQDDRFNIVHGHGRAARQPDAVSGSRRILHDERGLNSARAASRCPRRDWCRRFASSRRSRPRDLLHARPTNCAASSCPSTSAGRSRSCLDAARGRPHGRTACRRSSTRCSAA